MTKTRKHRGGANANQRTVSVKDPFKIKNGSHIIEANGQYYSIKNGHDKDHHIFESIDKYKYGFDKAAGIRFRKSNQTFNYQKDQILKYYNHNKKTEDVERINKIQYSVENVSEINKEFNQILKSMKDVLKTQFNFNDEKLNKMNFYDIEQNYYKVQSKANDNLKVDNRNKPGTIKLNKLNNGMKNSEQEKERQKLFESGILTRKPLNGQESPSSTTLHQGTNTQPLQNKRSPLFGKNGRVILPGKTSNSSPVSTGQHSSRIASTINGIEFPSPGANTAMPVRRSNQGTAHTTVTRVPISRSDPEQARKNRRNQSYKTTVKGQYGQKGGKKIKTKKRKRMRKNKTRKS